MAITCPACGTPADAHGEVRRAGRLTRCANCGTAWFARPAEDGHRRTRPAEDISDAIVVDEVPPFLARAASALPRQMPKVPPAALPALRYGAIGAGVILAVALLKAPIVSAFPNLPGASAAALGLEFRSVRSETIGGANGRTVIVEGEVVNTLSRPVDLPPLRVSLKGSDGVEVTNWVVQATTPRLGPGQAIGFRSARVAPPAAAAEVNISLADY
jgi:hypothetical protein